MKTPISDSSAATAKWDAIRAHALSLGFEVADVAHPHLPINAQTDLHAFLQQGLHGEMDWMERHADRREDPSHLWPEAKSVILLGMNYGPDYDPLEKLHEKENGLISCYALGKDYHDIIKKKLKVLGRWLVEQYGCEVKVFVDTAPLMEKPLAAQTALGWQGKHTCIVSREYGSWLFIGSVMTTLELPASAPHTNHCGECTRCLDICPTGAFIEAGKIDARKCISYLTIEHRGMIPREFRAAMGNRIYGCDDCLAVCPWNKFAQEARESAFHAREHMPTPPLMELLTLDDATFREHFAGSPIKRIGRDRFLRNALIAVGNSGNADFLPAVEALCRDASPLVRASAAWALIQLAPKVLVAEHAHFMLQCEADSDVRSEWQSTLL